MITAQQARERSAAALEASKAIEHAEKAILRASADGLTQYTMHGQPWDADGSEALKLAIAVLNKLGYKTEFTGEGVSLSW